MVNPKSKQQPITNSPFPHIPISCSSFNAAQPQSTHQGMNGGIQKFKDPFRNPVQLRVRDLLPFNSDGNFSLVYTAMVARIPAANGANGEAQQNNREEAPLRVALKKIIVPRAKLNNFREIYLLRLLATTRRHKNIIELLYTQRSTCNNEILYTMIFRFFPTTLLNQRVELSRQRSVLDIKLYVWQMFAGLDHLRRLHIIHRDMKPANLLVEPRTGQLKIADFGSATHRPFTNSSRPLGKYAVTRPYRPPELLLNAKTYNCMADVWSAGCIFIELFLGRTLFAPTDDTPTMLHLIYNMLGMPSIDDLRAINVDEDKFVPNAAPKVVWPMQELKLWLKAIGFNEADIPMELFAKILRFNPGQRLNGPDLLKDNYFRELFENGKRRQNYGALVSLAIGPEDRRSVFGTEV